MQLSPHFSLSEFLQSQYAARNGIDMTPPKDVLVNLERLANEVLEPIRASLGRPVFITSGYRPFSVNAAVGGSANSAHLYGRAADFVVPGVPYGETAWIVRKTCDELPVGKLIQEFQKWLHVQIEPVGKEPRRSYLYADSKNGQTVYSVWA